MMRIAVGAVSAFALAEFLIGPALAADPQTLEWSKIPTKTITLFYPGQSTYTNPCCSRPSDGAKASLS